MAKGVLYYCAKRNIKVTTCAAAILFSSIHYPTSSAFSPRSTSSIQQLRLSSSFIKTRSRTNNNKYFTTTPLRMSSSTPSSTTSTCTLSSPKTTFTIAQFPCLGDNYGYLIHDTKTGQTAAIDTPDAQIYQNELNHRNWKLSHVFNTHHHYDHTGGNEQLKEWNDGVQVYGPKDEEDQIPGLDVALDHGDTVKFGNTECSIIDVGGHTHGHIAYHFPNDDILFSGDALFALGCGRMFEGNPTQFWNSLKRLRSLPDETIVYCAHEYTTSNAKFAMSVEPGNEDLVTRTQEIKEKRAREEPTVPSTILQEKMTNPFLRVDVSSEIRNNCGVTDADSEYQAFAKVRKAKDVF